MKVRFVLFLLLFGSQINLLSAADWQTIYEKYQFKATANYAQTIDFCQRLADFSPWIHYTTFGQSAQGRDLPLLIVNKDKAFDAESVKQSGKVVLLVQAGIHAGEIDGKDAGLLLLRDFAVKKQHINLFDNVVLLFIPIFNVDGHERSGPYNRINQNGPKQMGWRTTALNLNLNRDYLKADAVEMQAWLKIFNQWAPDFFVDIHVTDGADYQYVITYNLDTHGVMGKPLNAFVKHKFEPELKRQMAEKGLPICNYVMFRKHHDVKSGLVGWVPSPRFSNGYTLLHNCPGLLVENHMLKDYQTRVTATYQLLISLLQILNNQQNELKKAIRQAQQQTLSSDFRESPFPLSFRRTSDSTMIDFLGFDYQVIKSDLSGGWWYQFNNQKPRSFHIPFFNHFVPDKQVQLPLAYLVPVEWQSVIQRLAWHGIDYVALPQDVELELETYRFEDVKFAPKSFEGRQMVNFKTRPVSFKRVYHKGSVLIPVQQKAGRVVVHIFEPDGPDSFVRWGFFNAIFEQKEYAESYVMETLARRMLRENPQLRQQFQQKIKNDSTFAQNPYAILNWFYRHSPYWDSFKDVYPVGKITNPQLFNKLMRGAQ